jgi:pimeloyl-ACP methyl ester carboxylesterase
MTAFVLVHGAGVGSWVWKKSRHLLWAAGHEVYTPSLTGLGERVHLMRPDINLSTHIEDVVKVIEYESLKHIVLVGHSYGGMVVTGVADRMPDCIDHLVYLDAQLPQDGESWHDVNRGRRPPPPPSLETLSPEERADVLRMTEQPPETRNEKIRLEMPIEKHEFTRTYIKATGAPRPPDGSSLWEAADRVKNDPDWRYRELLTSHAAQMTMPKEFVALLLELV